MKNCHQKYDSPQVRQGSVVFEDLQRAEPYIRSLWLHFRHHHQRVASGNYTDQANITSGSTFAVHTSHAPLNFSCKLRPCLSPSLSGLPAISHGLGLPSAITSARSADYFHSPKPRKSERLIHTCTFLSRVRLVCWLTSNLDMPHDPRLGCCTYCRSCCRPCRHIVAIPIAPASRHVFIKFACKISSTPSSTLHNSSTTAQRATEFLCTVKTACQKLSVHLMKRRLELSALGKRHRALS